MILMEFFNLNEYRLYGRRRRRRIEIESSFTYILNEYIYRNLNLT